MDEKTSLWVRTPAGPAYAHTKLGIMAVMKSEMMVVETQGRKMK